MPLKMSCVVGEGSRSDLSIADLSAFFRVGVSQQSVILFI